jgi:hypothetical protein
MRPASDSLDAGKVFCDCDPDMKRLRLEPRREKSKTRWAIHAEVDGLFADLSP